MAYDFEKLTADVATAMSAGEQAASAVADEGSCNTDSVVLRMPHANEEVVTRALARAGVTSSKMNCGWAGVGYLINPMSGGQANKRTFAAQAIYTHLRDAGHNVALYYQMY